MVTTKATKYVIDTATDKLGKKLSTNLLCIDSFLKDVTPTSEEEDDVEDEESSDYKQALDTHQPTNGKTQELATCMLTNTVDVKKNLQKDSHAS